MDDVCACLFRRELDFYEFARADHGVRNAEVVRLHAMHAAGGREAQCRFLVDGNRDLGRRELPVRRGDVDRWMRACDRNAERARKDERKGKRSRNTSHESNLHERSMPFTASHRYETDVKEVRLFRPGALNPDESRDGERALYDFTTSACPVHRRYGCSTSRAPALRTRARPR